MEILEKDAFLEEEIVTVSSRAIEKLRRDLGPDIVNALDDEKTVEIMLNPDGMIWQERLGEPMRRIGRMSCQRAEAVIKTVAGYHGKTITVSNPLVESELPLDGSRFAGQLPPVVQAPTFAIRKKAIAVFTIDQYVARGIMTAQQAVVIKKAVEAHKNILVITLDVTMTMLLKTILRMRPDRILVGEVRGPEALDMLDAWNTGHEGGAATLHANNEISALHRLKSLVTRHHSAPNEIEPLIGEAVHMIVHIAKTAQGRLVQGIIEISGYANGSYILQKV